MSKIDIVMPVKVVDDYTFRAINSVINQTFEDYRILIIADKASINKLMKNNYGEKIHYIESDNSEYAGEKRNIGITKAISEYLMFLDSDDELFSNKTLSTLYKNIKDGDYNIVIGSCVIYEEINRRYVKREDLINLEYKESTIKNFQIETGFYRCIYNTKFIKNNMLNFPNLKRFQDCVFMIRTLLVAGKFLLIPDFVYKYRKQHKIIKWNYDLYIDHIRGVYLLIKLSSQFKLKLLKRRMMKNIINTYKLRKPLVKVSYKEQLSLIKIKLKIILYVLSDIGLCKSDWCLYCNTMLVLVKL